MADILTAASNVTSGIRNTSNTIRTGISVLTGSGVGSASIRDRILNGFFGETSQFTPNVFTRLFDEPTYLTFRIKFNFDTDRFINSANAGAIGMRSSFDFFPEPLLAIPSKKGKDSLLNDLGEWRNKKTSAKDALATIYNVVGGNELTDEQAGIVTDLKSNIANANANINSLTGALNSYSTYDYLVDQLGEHDRADMLYLFVQALKDIQNNYPYYFQSIDGLGELSKIDPTKGMRLTDENNTLVIRCYEGLDLKVTQLMQLYKNVAWDNVYQRWILPDIMRFFTMEIYVSEIRLFHTAESPTTIGGGRMYPFGSALGSAMNATSYDRISNILNTTNAVLNAATVLSSGNLGTKNILNKIDEATRDFKDTMSTLSVYALCNNAINDVMPTICFECHQCEFDISDTLTHINELSSSNKEAPQPTLTIKVGRVVERQVYPLNADLVTGASKYTIDLSKDLMAGAYFNDEMLMANNKGQKPNDANAPTRISKTINRINSKIDGESAVNADLKYGGPYYDYNGTVQTTGDILWNSAQRALSFAATNLSANDMLNVLMSMQSTLHDHRSSAAGTIFEDKMNKIAGLLQYYVDSAIRNGLRYVDNELRNAIIQQFGYNRRAPGQPQTEDQNGVPFSAATNTEMDRSVLLDGANIYHSEATDDDYLIYNVSTGKYEERETDELRKNIADKPWYIYTKDSVSTATTGKLQKVLVEYGKEEFDEATNAISKIRDLSYGNEMVDAAEEDKNKKAAIGDNILEGVLTKISRSEATEKRTAIKAIAGIILEDSKSQATSKRQLTGFEKLN